MEAERSETQLFARIGMAIAQDENVVSAEMGNSAAMVYANYRQLVTKEQAEEWFAIVRR